MNTSSIVQKLWNYCNVLRDDGMSYGDYVEQLTYLLFLKMADEPVCVRTRTSRRTQLPHNQESLPAPGGAQVNPVPEKPVCASNDAGRYGWPGLIKKDGDELFDHYRHTLETLGNPARTARPDFQ